jgi:hypothetical protein
VYCHRRARPVRWTDTFRGPTLRNSQTEFFTIDFFLPATSDIVGKEVRGEDPELVLQVDDSRNWRCEMETWRLRRSRTVEGVARAIVDGPWRSEVQLQLTGRASDELEKLERAREKT